MTNDDSMIEEEFIIDGQVQKLVVKIEKELNEKTMDEEFDNTIVMDKIGSSELNNE